MVSWKYIIELSKIYSCNRKKNTQYYIKRIINIIKKQTFVKLWSPPTRQKNGLMGERWVGNKKIQTVFT